jgi:hypothetical protein
MNRLALWIPFGLVLSLVPLAAAALTEWNGREHYLELLVNAELLAVGFALAGASGADAITSSPPYQAGKRFLGGMTIVSAIFLALVYYIFHNKANFPIEIAKRIEIELFALAILLSVLSEAVAD